MRAASCFSISHEIQKDLLVWRGTEFAAVAAKVLRGAWFVVVVVAIQFGAQSFEGEGHHLQRVERIICRVSTRTDRKIANASWKGKWHRILLLCVRINALHGSCSDEPESCESVHENPFPAIVP